MGISPGGRPINESPLSASKTSNWVARAGGLPPYIRGVARGIAKRHGGKVTSGDIKIAIGKMKVWAAGGDNVTPPVQAAAAKALAEWAAIRARSKVDLAHAIARGDIDLAAVNKHHIAGTAYHWKHGYIPLDARTAALWKKKHFEEALKKQGKITTHEPEGVGFETDATSSRPTRSLGELTVIEKRAKAKEVIGGHTPEQIAAAKHFLNMDKNHSLLTRKMPVSANSAWRDENEFVKNELTKAAQAHLAGHSDHDISLNSYAHYKGQTGDGLKSMLEANKKWNADIRSAREHAKKVAGDGFVAQPYIPKFKKGQHVVGPDGREADVTGSRYTGGIDVTYDDGTTAHLPFDEAAKFETKRRARKAAPTGPKKTKPAEDDGYVRDEYDKVLHPRKGDILTVAEPVYGRNTRYRHTGGSWVREEQQADGSWKKGYRSTTSDDEVERKAHLGKLTGIESSGTMSRELTTRRLSPQSQRESEKYAQSHFGTETVAGFKAVSSIAAYVGNNGKDDDLSRAEGALSKGVHLLHENGTVVRIEPSMANSMTRDQMHKFAETVHDVMENHVKHTAVYPTNSEHGAPVFHVESKYARNRGWKTSRGETLAYVFGGDKKNVHVSPSTAKQNTTVIPSTHSSVQQGHFTHGHGDLKSLAHGTLVHELGHVLDNRMHGQTGSHSTSAAHSHFKQHAENGTGKYGMTNSAEGFAEAFTHSVARHAHGELLAKKTKFESEKDQARRASHDKVADHYESVFNWFITTGKRATA